MLRISLTTVFFVCFFVISVGDTYAYNTSYDVKRYEIDIGGNGVDYAVSFQASTNLDGWHDYAGTPGYDDLWGTPPNSGWNLDIIDSGDPDLLNITIGYDEATFQKEGIDIGTYFYYVFKKPNLLLEGVETINVSVRNTTIWREETALCFTLNPVNNDLLLAFIDMVNGTPIVDIPLNWGDIGSSFALKLVMSSTYDIVPYYDLDFSLMSPDWTLLGNGSTEVYALPDGEYNFIGSTTVAFNPEPSTMLMFTLGIFGIGKRFFKKRFRKKI